MSARGQALLKGASWLAVSQILVVVLQFAYAGLTSRIVSSLEFGAYGVALVVIAAANLVAAGGLSQAIMRMDDAGERSSRELASVALGLGLLGGVGVYFSAGLWAAVWNVPEAAAPIRVLALGTAMAPAIGVCNGVLRRLGKFKGFAIVNFGAGVMGMLVGAVAVFQLRSASALVVFPLVQQMVVLVLICSMCGRAIWPSVPGAQSLGSIIFSYKVLLSNVREYILSNILKIAVTRAIGGSALGIWSRSDVLTVQPFTMLQNSIMQVVYPEFSRSVRMGKSETGRESWGDLLALTAWVTVPAGFVLAAILPEMVPVLFGPGWGETAKLVPLVAIGACFQPITTLLAAGLESLGKFQVIFRTQVFIILVVVVIALGVLLTRSLALAVAGVGFSLLLRHAIHVYMSVKLDLINSRSIIKSYGWVLWTSFAYGLTSWTLLSIGEKTLHGFLVWVPLLVAWMLNTAGVILLRRRTQFWTLLCKYEMVPTSLR
ncbi:oligosaccharide flippase family protein [Rhodococcus ruber]|uniref:Oligosaccharide flippase family protein n=1 Tax=Rhodococcus ruber TaxID=1830 RepID=A0ABT4MC02_9NOCA|nr:oligosaccharide flippase family protein [Rhodococcus ruber]MCZ4518050.1 oligosaccharide flippase family protein [Rhodococcus ruber]